MPFLIQEKPLNELSEAGAFTPDELERILSQVNKSETNLTRTSKKLGRYFPLDYTQKQMETTILKLLDGWHSGQISIAWQNTTGLPATGWRTMIADTASGMTVLA